MFWLKMCLRCQGDLYVQDDWFGKYLACLQCGYLKDVVKEPKAQEWKTPAVTEKRKAA